MEVVDNKYNQQLKNGIDPKESIQYLYDTHERMVPSKLIEEYLYDSIEIIYTYTNEFDYKKYMTMYPDLKTAGITSELECYKHWIEFGKVEGRCAGIINSIEPYIGFEWESYLELNPDLHDIGVLTESDAIMHWITVGRLDNRQVTQASTRKETTTTTMTLNIIDGNRVFTNKKYNRMWSTRLKQDLHEKLDYEYYLNHNEDLLKANICNHYDVFLHWVLHGKLEGRIGSSTPSPTPPSSSSNVDNIIKIENPKVLPMYIINLQERIDKKMDMIYQLKEIGYTNYEFFKACDKKNQVVKEKYEYFEKAFDENTIRTTPAFYKSGAKRKVIGSIGAVGLIHSTIELFKQIEEKKQGHVIICEDDAQFHKSFKYMLKPVRILMDETDMVYLGYNSHIPSINDIIVNDDSKIIEKIPKHEGLNTLYGTYGYICSPKFRQKIIELGIDWFIQNNCTIDYGYNVLYREGIVTGAVPTGEHLIIPDVFDEEAINGDRKDKVTFYKDRCIELANYFPQIKNDKQFVFIVPSYNNEQWVERNLFSMFNQTYTNWRMIYINDYSTDSTHQIFTKLSTGYQDKITYVKNNTKFGQAFNRYRAYNMCEDNEICVMLDGDDWLANKYVLAYINKFMIHHDVDITYGKFDIYSNGKNSSFTMPGDYPQSVIDRGRYRVDSWRACHLRVMKAEYLKHVRPTDFLDENGDFIICTTDMVESFACLEQCNGRHKICSETTMIYNKENSMQFVETSHYSDVNKEKKALTQKNVRNLPSYRNMIQKEKIVVIDVNNPLYKAHIDTYRTQMQKDSELFLCITDELPMYMNTLNKFKQIFYL